MYIYTFSILIKAYVCNYFSLIYMLHLNTVCHIKWLLFKLSFKFPSCYFLHCINKAELSLAWARHIYESLNLFYRNTSLFHKNICRKERTENVVNNRNDSSHTLHPVGQVAADSRRSVHHEDSIQQHSPNKHKNTFYGNQWTLLMPWWNWMRL